MLTVVTGAAGFIGANIVKRLNARGETRILAVDNLKRGDKFLNLTDCDIADYMDKSEFLTELSAGALDGQIKAVFHQGACSDTMETDGAYMMANNYRYSVTLLNWCQAAGVPFIYASSASVYGGGDTFREQREFEAPLNVYAYSKFLFDQYVRTVLASESAQRSQIAGFRYFNVYGQREAHKGRMASVAWHFLHQYQKEGRVRLFEGIEGYANGAQLRDFVAVDDVASVNLWFLDHPEVSGIFNVGTGRAQSFNDVAVTVVNSCRRAQNLPALSLQALCDSGQIEYIAFPEALRGKYQSYTQADLQNLRTAGYSQAFATVEEGVARYVEHLLE